jgi:hypothetical protein
LDKSTQHVARPIRPIKWCAAPLFIAKIAWIAPEIGRIIRFPILSRASPRVIGQRVARTPGRLFARFKSPVKNFVGKRPTEILDYSVIP